MSFPAMSRKITEKFAKITSQQLILLALAASVLLAALLYFYLSGLENRQVDKPQKLDKVVIAAVDIPEKAVIEASMLKTVSVPAGLAPADAITDARAIVGKIAKLKILQGDPLTAQKFFADASMAGFTGSIPADKRAISIAITDITGISGFAKPGDYVDVILINSKSRKNAISGTTILQNVLLLAVNKTNAGKTADNSKESMATATLALAPADTLRLAVSQSQGTLYLALRPFKPQNGLVPTSEFLAYQYEPAAEPQQSAAADYAVPPPVPSAHSIPVIRGNSVSTVEVR